MNTQLYVAHYSVKNPVKSASENRWWVITEVLREATRQTSFKYMVALQKVGKLPRKGWQDITAKICHRVELSLTARQYMKDLLESRSKSRYTSS